MKKRSEIEEKYKWDLSKYFVNDDAWNLEYNNLDKDIEEIKKFKGKLKKKKDILSCLKLLEKMSVNIDALAIYVHLIDTDLSNSKYQAMYNKLVSKCTEEDMATAFIVPELSKLPDKFLNKLQNDKDFEDFSRTFFDIIREKPYVLPYESEKLLSGTSLFTDTFSKNHSNFENADLKFFDVVDKNGKKHKMSNSDAYIYLRSDDEVLRENAYKELQGAYGRYNHFLSSNYLGSVNKDVFFAKARGFSSSLAKKLFYTEIPQVVYDNLVESIENNLNLNHKYFEEKRKLLGIKTFKISDVYYNPIKINSKKYTYQEALDLVCKVLNIFGDEYTDYLKYMAQNRMIDVYPNENKRGGAYETMGAKKHPLVLLNFMGTFNDVSTMAHELGHAMHSVYSDKNQSVFHSQYTIFLAEIASTVNETLLNDFMTKNSKDSNEKIYYLNEFLQTVNSTIFRQTMFADFEKIIHEKVENNDEISSNVLNDTYFDLVKKYFGKKVKICDEVKYEWSRIPHFFTPFYVYQYATGLISAINIVNNLQTGKISVEDYKKFLSAGCSTDPISILKFVKVDYTTTEPFETAFKYIEERVKMYSKEIKNITK